MYENASWIEEAVESAKRLDANLLPLNARLLWEMVRDTVDSGRYSRILEDAYHVVGEAGLSLNVDEVDPYFTQMQAWMDGLPVPDESAVTYRRMWVHRAGGHVYVAENQSSLFKIGFSKDVARRIRQLESKHGPLAVRLSICGNGATKALIHSLFRSKRKTIGSETEWFDLDHEDLIRLTCLTARKA